ncbi:uncharacterized protein MEPE_05890 [Melanopsichium pennsylvanicum]|uniref:Uncharacterized protein n=1 Tax=Melanopsichium pennsylvanicum TaxID=63383 RepID=A0AAJ5C7R1_9BASI|nr:uncharacterized protein MEPE_05890 [Melanopsichium pennsylvanicum]
MRQDNFSLAHVGDQLEAWSRSPLHPTLLPVGALSLIHAARVSHATRQVAGSHESRLGLWQGLLLNQILMFGGVVISGMLLGIASPLLVAWPVILLYGGVHVLLDVTPFGKLLLDAQDVEVVGILMDLSFALLDGVLRAEGIVDLGVELVRKHPSPELASSVSAALINSAIIGGGVPLLIDLFRLDSSSGEWGIRSPSWAKDPFSGTNDIFSALFLGYVYLTLTDPALAHSPIFGGVAQQLGVGAMSNRDVRTFCSLLLGGVLLAEKAVKLSNEARPVKLKPTLKPIAARDGSANANANESNRKTKQASRKKQ